jgi:beta-1,4-mannooligosaccharide/beta-1,4-mannosyl-N-acetylglucosamine phosphorylase
MGGCILDIDEPWKVKYRCGEYLLSPQADYECWGDVPNVAFPCAALCDPDSGKLAIYYGCADTHVGLAFAQVDELVEYIKSHS